MTKKQKKNLTRIILSSAIFILLNIVPRFFLSDSIQNLFGVKIAIISLYAVAYLIIGYDILFESFFGILHGQIFDENFLMAIATVGAIVLAVYQKNGDFNEAVAVMLFYQIGEFFQSYAVGKSRKSITDLMDIRPDYANIEQDGKIIQVSPEEVSVGQIIIVQPGEKNPIDGVVVEGVSSLNTSALTGESLPRDVGVGDEVISGSINMTGVLKIRTQKEFGESTASKILALVEESGFRKSRSENFITKFAKIYTPAVCVSAFILAILPPLINLCMKNQMNWGVWIYRALTFLVISCPCALVISIPLSFFAGLGAASKEGVLIKGSNFLETLSLVKTVVFDKTGTLTKGVFEVTGIHHNEIENKKILEYAALAECSSSHPISKSLQMAYQNEIDRSRVKNINEISGEGVQATVDDVNIACGNSKLMERLNIKYIPCHHAGTIIHVAINNEYAGHIVISDVVKPDSAVAISELKKAGVSKSVMLTGDSLVVAEKVAKELGLDEFHADLLPTDKVSWIEKLLANQNKNEKLLFAGDGINDAPVLSRADVGVAMGALGSDAAIEAADIVIMDDNPIKISRGIKISRKCIRIVYENIVLALFVKASCLLLGAIGIANMWLAIFADVGVMVLAVLNAVRALRCK